jgi:serine/threonine-protein kinase
MEPQVGEQLGPYRLVHELGRGSIATVFGATRNTGEPMVALKLFAPDLAGDASFQQRALRLSRAPELAQQPGLMRLHQTELVGDALILPMELMAGGSLLNPLKSAPRSRHELVERLRRLVAVASTLAELHALSIIHGNITPGNMLLDAPHNVAGATLKLGDVSLAIYATMTRGRLVGNPIYMAPERFQAELSPASDVYAFGVTLYEAVCGQPPFQVGGMAEASQKHQHEPVPSPSLFQMGLPATLETLVLGCLAKDPAARPAGATLVQTLKAAIDELDPPPAPAAPAPLLPTLRIVDGAPSIKVFGPEGQAVGNYPLRMGLTSVGRQSRNEIALPVSDTNVSREHLRISWDGQRIAVTDCSANGTFREDGTRLHAGVAESWAWHTRLRIAEFTLVLEPPQAAAAPTTIIDTSVSRPVAATVALAKPVARRSWWRALLDYLRN